MKKILFLGAGSKSDPSFENIPDIKYMENQKGITITKPAVIGSCHGCRDLMTKYSRQMQDLIDKGNRVVGILAGGLYFGLPSIQATEVTFPIISCPLDFVSYQAFITPSGNATIATVGIEEKFAKDEYRDLQRGRALHVAGKILNLEGDTVAVRGKGNLENLTKKLNTFSIRASNESKLILTYSNEPVLEKGDHVQVWADPLLNASNANSIRDSEEILSKTPNTIQVRSDQDLAIYAAKILSLQRPDIREKLKAMSEEKRKSYQERNLVQELGG